MNGPMRLDCGRCVQGVEKSPRTCHIQPRASGPRRRTTRMKSTSMAHRVFGVALLATSMLFGVAVATVPQPATAQSSPGLSGAENYVSANVQRGLTILNNKTLPDAERRNQFREFLTNLTDIRRIAVFTL